MWLPPINFASPWLPGTRSRSQVLRSLPPFPASTLPESTLRERAVPTPAPRKGSALFIPQYPLGTHGRWTHLDPGGPLRGPSQRRAVKPLGLLRITAPQPSSEVLGTRELGWQPRRSEASAPRTAAVRGQARWRSARLLCLGPPRRRDCFYPIAGASPGQRTRCAARVGLVHARPDVPRPNPSSPTAARGGWPKPFPPPQRGMACACRARAGRLNGCPKGTASGGASAALNRAAPHGRACVSRRGGARAPCIRVQRVVPPTLDGAARWAIICSRNSLLQRR
jgi:hypothetical protein